VGVVEHEARLAILERDCEDFKCVVAEIRDSLQALVRLEERHNETSRAMSRAFDGIAKLESRMTEVEKEMPPLLEMRKLVIGAVCFVLIAFGGAVMSVIGIKGS